MGKVLLAGLSESDQLELVAEMTLRRCAPNTITTKEALLGALEHVAEEGLAFNDEELAEGLVSIAVPVRDQSREAVAAIGMAAHTSMISLADLSRHLLPHLLATADLISARLGYRRDDEAER
jgi:IclR family pca regulon transcriptional regulator